MPAHTRLGRSRGPGGVRPKGRALARDPCDSGVGALASAVPSASIEVRRRGLGDVDDAWRLLGLVGGGDGDHLLAALDQRAAVEVGHLGVGVGVRVVG